MNIHNPLDKELSLNYKGEMFFLEPGKTVKFPEDVAKQWLYIYGFLEVLPETPEIKEVKQKK